MLYFYKTRRYEHTNQECGFPDRSKNFEEICKLCGYSLGDHFGYSNHYICPADYNKAYDRPILKPRPKPQLKLVDPESSESFKLAFPNANPSGRYHGVICTLCGQIWEKHHGGINYAGCPSKPAPYQTSQCVKLFGSLFPSMLKPCISCGETYENHYYKDPSFFCPDQPHPGVMYTIKEKKRRKIRAEKKAQARERARRNQKTEALCAPWGLEPKLNLPQHASDFYLLTAANIDYPENIKIKLKLRQETEFLAEQFSAYLDMVIGGEIRHFPRQCAAYRDNPTETRDSLTQSAKALLTYILHECPIDRNEAWADWRAIRKKHGIAFLEASIELLSLDWGGHVYGGKTWAGAGKVLLSYLTGEISATTFVDTAWGLQHNSDVIFDKLWSITDLKELLEANLNDNLKELKQWASPPVLSLLKTLPKPVW
jgi:hypothetical protein